MSSASKQVAVAVPPAARLSEEAMDLVCAFVREDGKDHTAVATLRALCRTSRRWLSSAVRALWFDPSRALCATEEGAERLLNLLLLRSPDVGRRIKRLHFLPEMIGDPYDPPDSVRTSLAMENLCIGIFLRCPNLEHVTLSPDLGEAVLHHLSLLPRLRSLETQAGYDEEDDEVYSDFLITLLKQLPASVKQLSLNDVYFLEGIVDAGILFPVELLKLTGIFSPTRLLNSLEMCTPSLQSLWLQTIHSVASSSLIRLPSLLTSLKVEAIVYKPPPHTFGASCGETAQRWAFPSFAFHSRLTHLTLDFVYLSLRDFASLTTTFPSLASLNLPDSTWNCCEWVAPFYKAASERVADAVAALPSLCILSLGFLPLSNSRTRLPCLERVCRDRDVALSWQPFQPDDWNNDIGELEALEEEAIGAYEQDDGVYEDESSEEWVADVDEAKDWERWRLSRFPDEHLPLSHTPASFTPPTSPSASSTFSGEDDAFFPAAPDEPRTEEGFEAEDEVDEDDREPWLGWQDRVDFEEEDQAWREFRLYPEYGALEQ
ncbi:hypothetical protein JCM10213_006368 [Rhodosporidiobolus nylandii]